LTALKIHFHAHQKINKSFPSVLSAVVCQFELNSSLVFYINPSRSHALFLSFKQVDKALVSRKCSTCTGNTIWIFFV